MAVGLKKLRVLALPDGEKNLTICTSVSTQSQDAMNRRTDGRTEMTHHYRASEWCGGISRGMNIYCTVIPLLLHLQPKPGSVCPLSEPRFFECVCCAVNQGSFLRCVILCYLCVLSLGCSC